MEADDSLTYKQKPSPLPLLILFFVVHISTAYSKILLNIVISFASASSKHNLHMSFTI